MTSTNAHGPKQAILYARVSTDEQARSGYSLAQQIEALREYAAKEGYKILEEITDEGQSGAYLARPGLDRVRDLVAAGGVSVVLAQDRDRFARKVVLNGLLDEEFSKHGCATKALNDYGDDSPEGALMRGIQNQFAEYERAKIIERTRRGKERKAREGKILRAPKPPYGFRYNTAADGLVVHDTEMVVVERIFRLAAEGLGPQAIQTRLCDEGTPSPKGERVWPRPTLERILRSDLYGGHTHEELAALVSAEVLARLDKNAEYGVWWFGYKSIQGRSISEPDENGGRRYRRATTTRIRPKEERIAVPVPAHLPRWLVNQARATLATNRPPERKHLTREWELRGLLRCSCGWKMRTHTVSANRKGAAYHYYTCKQRKQSRGTCSCTQKAVKASEAENAVWSFISDFLRDPEEIRRGVEHLIDRERGAQNVDLEHEAEFWARKIAECDRRRSAYQDQQAAGLMTLEELDSKLMDLENARTSAERELVVLRDHRQRVEQLENSRDTLMESMAGMLPGALACLSSEDKSRLYRMLRLEVVPTGHGYEVSGVFGTPEPSRPVE